MGIISLMLSAFSYAISLKLRDENALAPLLNTISQPLLLTAGILLPLDMAPGWLRRVADWNPFSWAVDGVRALFAGHPGADSVWQAMVVIGALTLVTVVWASRAFAKGVR
jgi:ABC-2 type transport system permease protein